MVVLITDRTKNRQNGPTYSCPVESEVLIAGNIAELVADTFDITDGLVIVAI